MLENARRVLADCKHAHELLEDELQAGSFRILWVAGIAMARAVGHVLQKVDGESDKAVKAAVASAYSVWKSNRSENKIFWDFIEEERNQVLKQYEIGFLGGQVGMAAGAELHTLDGNVFCPITEGPFAGDDCRDVLEQAIRWWEQQLALIEFAARQLQ